jgi:multimeric flavodoxin WrbA
VIDRSVAIMEANGVGVDQIRAVVIAGSIRLGDNSSVTRRVIERLYGYSGLLNSRGQYAYYGRVGGCLLTGNADGDLDDAAGHREGHRQEPEPLQLAAVAGLGL